MIKITGCRNAEIPNVTVNKSNQTCKILKFFFTYQKHKSKLNYTHSLQSCHHQHTMRSDLLFGTLFHCNITPTELLIHIPKTSIKKKRRRRKKTHQIQQRIVLPQRSEPHRDRNAITRRSQSILRKKFFIRGKPDHRSNLSSSATSTRSDGSLHTTIPVSHVVSGNRRR